MLLPSGAKVDGGGGSKVSRGGKGRRAKKGMGSPNYDVYEGKR